MDLSAFAARAARTEEDRGLSDETIAEIRPLLRDFDLAATVRLGREIGAVCLSTGWVTALYLVHRWMLGLFPDRVDADLVTFASAPTGFAEESHGGYVVSGRWSWCSGIAHAEWCIVVAMAPEPRLFLVPRAEVVVHDVWFTSGMRGTGSNDVELTDVFVPAGRSVPLADVVGAPEPLISVLVLAGAAPVLGAATGLLDLFALRQHKRPSTTGPALLARATAALDAAGLLLDHAVTAVGPATRTRSRLVGAHVVAVARQVVNEVCAASGASAQLMSSPLQRVQRDVNTIAGHAVFDADAAYALHGVVSLGGTPDPKAMY